MNKDLGSSLFNSANIIILVDHHISYRNFNECTNISTSTAINIVNFGPNLQNDIHSAVLVHVITDVESVIKVVWNYYR